MRTKDTSDPTPEGVRRKGLSVQMVPLVHWEVRGHFHCQNGGCSTYILALPPGLGLLHGTVLPPAKQGGVPYLRSHPPCLALHINWMDRAIRHSSPFLVFSQIKCCNNGIQSGKKYYKWLFTAFMAFAI